MRGGTNFLRVKILLAVHTFLEELSRTVPDEFMACYVYLGGL